MIDIQLLGDIIIIGVLLFSAMMHGVVYYGMRDHRMHGVFAILCVIFAAYTGTNIFALYFSSDVNSYVFSSRLSSVFVIMAIFVMSWFAAEFIKDTRHIPLKPIALALAPFFIINLFMEYGILWSSIEGIKLSERPWGGNVAKPVNAVISWPMYGLWAVLAGIYLLLIRAAYKSMRQHKHKRGTLLFVSLVALSLGYGFDVTIDMGINPSYFYISEILVLTIVIMMSLQLTDELRLHASNLENLVKERTKELEYAIDDLESFSYSVSHDLRAPLRVINGYLKIIEEDNSQSLDKDSKILISKVIDSAHHMDSLIEGLLGLSRITKKELSLNDVDITKMATKIIDDLKESDPQREVSVTIEENIRCRCDPVLTKILMENLINNAWKYTANTDKARISINKHISESGKKGFRVFDNGIGFSEAQADKIFLPFQRLHPENEYPGIGIGLATVDRIIKRHNGEIVAKSNKDQGTAFEVVFN